MDEKQQGLGLTTDRSTGRRSTDTNELISTDGMPWQVRAIALIGVPAAIACFLVWFLAVRETSALEGIRDTLKPHVAAAQSLAEELRQLEQDHRDSNIRLEQYMRILCVQQSRTQTERQTCLSVR